ncbi:P-loop containing nucleoside triphosphate hydrolase protein [Gautieria morchelliformis]|nr:P-loop containing nucleoside triphosphate hydrolase protein [Gautieria morchelliformis]
MFLKPQTNKDSSKKHTVDPALQPWVEKYRPKTIEDISAQEHTVAVLRKTLNSSNLPHTLFYGPPGTGKTSTILALSRQLFGPDNFRNRVLELNASDERGITVVREKIKTFAKQTPRAAVSSEGKTFPCPPYKIIILDEADSMTQDAQAALRRIMETYANITRFCLVCNYVTRSVNCIPPLFSFPSGVFNRIIEPLASRCSKFRFTPLDDRSTRSRIEYIAQQEAVAVSPEVISTLIQTSGGDLRRSITYLQSAQRLSSSTSPPTPITSKDIQEIAGIVPDETVENLGRVLGVEIIGGSSMEVDGGGRARGFDGVRTQVRSLMREGWGAGQLLSQLHDLIILHPTINSLQKSKCALAFAEADKALCDGADEELWILEVALRVWKALG